MTFAVAVISLEQELSKEKALQHVRVALNFLRIHSTLRFRVCENTFETAIIIKVERTIGCEYIQIDTQEPDKVLVPIIEIETGLEELVEKKVLSNIEHILLTTCESRKHDRERNDWSLLLEKRDGAEQFVEALDREGIFNE